ncbi:MAG: hypothetical protein OSA98_14630 [Rubripirellula sp.]|nr:hypothetical protein [Rubripirellula sp.]
MQPSQDCPQRSGNLGIQADRIQADRIQADRIQADRIQADRNEAKSPSRDRK